MAAILALGRPAFSPATSTPGVRTPPPGPGGRLPRDQARTAAAGDERERPAGQDQDPVLESDQVEDVDPEPQQPGDRAAEVQPLDLGDGAAAADRGEVALVDVAERLDRLAGEPALDRGARRSGPAASPPARRPGGPGRRRRADFTRTMSPSAITSGWPGSVRSGSTVTPPGAVGLGARGLRQAPRDAGRGDAGGPHDGARADAPRRAVGRLELDAGLVDVDDQLVDERGHAEAARAGAPRSRTGRAGTRRARDRPPRRAGSARRPCPPRGSRAAACRARARRSGRPSRRRSGPRPRR